MTDALVPASMLTVVPGVVAGVAAAAGSASDETADQSSIAVALELVRTELGMDLAYISEVDGDTVVVERFSGDAAAFGIEGRVSLPREETFCQRVLDGRLPSLIPDASRDARTAALRATREMKLGAYASFPLTFGDGRVYGTLCAVSHHEIGLDDRDLGLLKVLARLVANQLEHELAIPQLSQLAVLVNEVGDGIMSVTVDGIVVSWNPACERIYGYTAQHAVGANIIDLTVVPGDEARLLEQLAATAAGERIEAEVRRRRADGSLIDVSVTLAPIRSASGAVSSIAAVARDITQKVRRDQFRAIERAVIAALADAEDAAEAAAGTLRVLGEGMRCDYAALWEPDRDGRPLRCASRWIREGSPLTRAAEELTAAGAPGVGRCAQVMETGEPIWIDDLHELTETPAELAAAAAGLRTVVAIPLVKAGAVVGVVEFCSRLEWPESPSLLAAGAAVLARLADALGWHHAQEAVRAGRDALEVRVHERTQELQRALGELEAAQIETVHRLSRAVEFRDEDTGEHIARISALAGQIAEGAGLDVPTRRLIERASPLHDVGKVAIPDSVLLKPGALTHEERAVIETHAEIGYELLRGSSSAILMLAAEVARTHHERYDGRGYPRGLAGDEIPIAGRIVAIADVYDALTSDRVYRPAMSVHDALAILRQGRGTQFDPVLLDVFLAAH